MNTFGKKKVPDEPDEEPPDKETKIGETGTDIEIISMLFLLLETVPIHRCLLIESRTGQIKNVIELNRLLMDWTSWVGN